MKREENKDYEMKEISVENNNFLSLKIENNKQISYTEFKNTNNNKRVMSEINYSPDVLRYKFKKILGIKFYHVGNTYVFGFINKFSQPLFCIDNLYYLHLIIYIIELIIYILGNHYLYNKIEHWKQNLFNCLLLSFFIIYTLLILINPGVIIYNREGYKFNGYCNKCNIYYLQDEQVTHCSECDICVKKVDHHCNVVRKCITKRNIVLFFSMVFNFLGIYIFSLINIIIYAIHYFTKKNK